MNKRLLAPATLRAACALIVFAAASQISAYGQGCVAARGAGVICHPPISNYQFDEPSRALTRYGKDKSVVEPMPIHESRFRVTFGYRWLYSDRHFVGDDEQEHRDEEGSSVVNDSHFFDLGLEYRFTDRFTLALTVPFSTHERSSSVRTSEDKPIFRYSVRSGGLGDLRLVGTYWLLDPKRNPNGNVLVGLGVDVPTGEKDQTDTHYRRVRGTERTIERFTRNVDQSVQPGDGGWGAIVELYAYQRIGERANLYLQGSYTITPEEKNGVLTLRSNPFEAEMAVADTYLARAGVDYVLWPEHNVVVSLGARIEGVTVRDLTGGSEGFRRPGYAVSVEPSISWRNRDWAASLSVPVAVYRNRQRSVADEQESELTGTWEHGDAAFADFLVMFSLSKQF